MIESRRDHACLYVEFERSRGVLVTGGQGARDEVRFEEETFWRSNLLKKKIVKVLASAEFYDLDTQQWEMVGSMQVIRMMNTKVKERDKLTKRKIKEILSTTITKTIFIGGQNRACDQPGVRLAYGDRRSTGASSSPPWSGFLLMSLCCCYSW